MERELLPYAPLIEEGQWNSGDENISMIAQNLVFQHETEIELEPIQNLDVFLQSLYHYWREKGLWAMMIGEIFRLTALAFIVAISAILLLYVRWGALQNACIQDKTCDILTAVYVPNPWQTGNLFYNIFCSICLLAFSVFWLWKFTRFLGDVGSMWRIRDFCLNRLGISEGLLPTLTWPELVYRLIRVQDTVRLCVIDDMTELDVVCRIMRKENYLIAMINNGIIPLTFQFPFIGPRVLLTKTMEWNLYFGLFYGMYDDDFRIKKSFLQKGGDQLRRRFQTMAALNLIVSPFVILFMSIYFFMRNAEKFYHRPAMFGARRWTQMARWRMREINEMPHYVQNRLEAARKDADRYINMFPTPILTHASKLVSFIAGSFMALLIAMTLIDEQLLERPIAGRNIVWWLGVLGLILAASRVFLREEESPVENPEIAMMQVFRRTHYLPKHWRGRAHTREVKLQFEQLFQYRLIIFFEEMASIILMPYILAFKFTTVADDIQQFFCKFTDFREGLGDVCSLSLFDLQKHGNVKYASPQGGSKETRSRQGKIEKSLISFAATYPTWKTNKQIKEFLQSIYKNYYKINQQQQQQQQQLATSQGSFVMVESTLQNECFQPLQLETIESSKNVEGIEMSEKEENPYNLQQFQKFQIDRQPKTDEIYDSQKQSQIFVESMQKSVFYDCSSRIERSQFLLQQHYEDNNEEVQLRVGRGRIMREMELMQSQHTYDDGSNGDQGQQMRHYHPLMP